MKPSGLPYERLVLLVSWCRCLNRSAGSSGALSRWACLGQVSPSGAPRTCRLHAPGPTPTTVRFHQAFVRKPAAFEAHELRLWSQARGPARRWAGPDKACAF
jgi:hypothetical protein